MSLRVNLDELLQDIAHSRSEVEAVKLPANETESVDRPALWNRAIGRLQNVAFQLLANQALLVGYLRDLADDAGEEGEDVKPVDNSGGNGDDSAKE